MLKKLFLMSSDHRPVEEIAARQEMQAALIEKMCPMNDDITSYATEWMHHHSDDFRIAYNELSHENPTLNTDWQTKRQETLALVVRKMQDVELR